MEREAFVFENGQTFTAWNVLLTGFRQHRETFPREALEAGSSLGANVLRYIVETADVSFCALPGTIVVGQQGQLSLGNDGFYDVMVCSVEGAGDHILVCGEATRKFGYEVSPT